MIDAWRLCNAVLGLLAALWLTRAMWKARHRLSTRYLLLGFALCHCMGVTFIAGVANVFFDLPLVGVSMVTTAIVWVLLALHPRFNDPSGTPPR